MQENVIEFFSEHSKYTMIEIALMKIAEIHQFLQNI